METGQLLPLWLEREARKEPVVGLLPGNAPGSRSACLRDVARSSRLSASGAEVHRGLFPCFVLWAALHIRCRILSPGSVLS